MQISIIIQFNILLVKYWSNVNLFFISVDWTGLISNPPTENKSCAVEYANAKNPPLLSPLIRLTIINRSIEESELQRLPAIFHINFFFAVVSFIYFCSLFSFSSIAIFCTNSFTLLSSLEMSIVSWKHLTSNINIIKRNMKLIRTIYTLGLLVGLFAPVVKRALWMVNNTTNKFIL